MKNIDKTFHPGRISLSQHTCYVVKGGALGIPHGGATQVSALWRCMWQGWSERELCRWLGSWLAFSNFLCYKQIGAFWCWLPGEWVCVHLGPWGSLQQTLLGGWEFLLPPQWPQVFTVRGFEAWFPHTGPLGCVVCLAPQLFLLVSLHTNVGLPVCHSPPCRASSEPQLPSPPLLPVCLNISLLTPWLLEFHTVWFLGSSGYFLFLNLLLSFFWLCEEAKCIYLHVQLGQKSIFLCS